MKFRESFGDSGVAGSASGRMRIAGGVAHHRGPGAHHPFRDQATLHVGVFGCESARLRPCRAPRTTARRRPPVGQRSGQHQFAAFLGRPGVFQVGAAELGAALEHVRDVCIEREGSANGASGGSGASYLKDMLHTVRISLRPGIGLPAKLWRTRIRRDISQAPLMPVSLPSPPEPGAEITPHRRSATNGRRLAFEGHRWARAAVGVHATPRDNHRALVPHGRAAR
jgi:hypothetical protein